MPNCRSRYRARVSSSSSSAVGGGTVPRTSNTSFAAGQFPCSASVASASAMPFTFGHIAPTACRLTSRSFGSASFFACFPFFCPDCFLSSTLFVFSMPSSPCRRRCSPAAPVGGSCSQHLFPNQNLAQPVQRLRNVPRDGASRAPQQPRRLLLRVTLQHHPYQYFLGKPVQFFQAVLHVVHKDHRILEAGVLPPADPAAEKLPSQYRGQAPHLQRKAKIALQQRRRPLPVYPHSGIGKGSTPRCCLPAVVAGCPTPPGFRRRVVVLPA